MIPSTVGVDVIVGSFLKGSMSVKSPCLCDFFCKWIQCIGLSIVCLFLLIGCSDQSGSVEDEGATGSQPDYPYMFGILINPSGLGDLGFTDMQYNGLMRGAKRFNAGVLLEQLPAGSSLTDMGAALDGLVERGSQTIFCSSWNMKEAMLKAAAKYPNVKFIITDGILDAYAPNMASFVFKSGQAAYLTGFLASKMSKTKVLGVIGGMNTPPVQEFIGGFSAGVDAANDGSRIVIKYLNIEDPDHIPWNNPGMARKLAEDMAREYKADTFFPVVGASAIGVYNYVKENDKYAIGIDSDQDYLAKGAILTSVLKRLDVGVECVVEEIMTGNFKSGSYIYGIKDGGVGLSPMLYTRQLIPDDVIAEMEALKQDIIDGKITVPTAMGEL